MQTDQISEKWLASTIRPFLRGQSDPWLNRAALECARNILFYLNEQPKPDWADVREAARNAGWRISRDTHTVETYWNARRLDADGHPDPGLGWVDIGIHDGHCRANLVSPGHPKDSVVLSDPTPARVLEAARLVGLDGAS